MYNDEIIGTIATVFSVIVFAGPAVQFYKILRGRLNFEEAPTVLIATMYCNCLAWYAYGELLFSQPVQICNLIGCCLLLLFSFTYLAYEIKKYTIDAIINTLIILFGTWTAYRGLIYILGDYPDTVGNICLGTYFIALLYPLHLIYRVIREKNYKLVSYIITGCTIISSIIWTIYGIYRLYGINYHIIFANSLGVIVGIAEIVISRVWKVKYPTIEQAREVSTLGIESNANDEIYGKQETKTEDENEEKVNKSKAKPVKIVTKIE